MFSLRDTSLFNIRNVLISLSLTGVTVVEVEVISMVNAVKDWLHFSFLVFLEGINVWDLVIKAHYDTEVAVEVGLYFKQRGNQECSYGLKHLIYYLVYNILFYRKFH